MPFWRSVDRWVDRNLGDKQSGSESEPESVDSDLGYGPFYRPNIEGQRNIEHQRSIERLGLSRGFSDSIRGDIYQHVEYVSASPKSRVETLDSDTESPETESCESMDKRVLKVRFVEFPDCVEKGIVPFYYAAPTHPEIIKAVSQSDFYTKEGCHCRRLTPRIDLGQFTKVEEIAPRIISKCWQEEEEDDDDGDCPFCEMHQHHKKCDDWKASMDSWRRINGGINQMQPAEQTVPYEDYMLALDDMDLVKDFSTKRLDPETERMVVEKALKKAEAKDRR